MSFRSFQQQDGYEPNKDKDAECSQRILLIIDDKSRSNESTYSKEQIDELYPVILPIIDEYFEDAEVGEDVHHAAGSSSYQQSDGQIEEAKVERTNNERYSTDCNEDGEQAMIWHQMCQVFDKRSSKQIAYGSGQEHKRKVGLILVGDFTEVDYDGANCCYCTPVKSKYQGVGGEVNIFKFNHLNNLLLCQLLKILIQSFILSWLKLLFKLTQKIAQFANIILAMIIVIFKLEYQGMLAKPTLLIIISALIPFISPACTNQRCCLVSTCTTSYCIQKNSQTWNSTQNFANYGYTKLVMVSSQCVPCDYSCQSCSSETSCSTCMQGFYMSNSKCILCSYGCLSCVVANSISKCLSCSTGTYLDSSTVSCKNCATGAASCTSATVITACKTGYFLTSNSLFCLTCPSNCVSCPTSNSICSSCSTGYYLTNSSCFACTVKNCAACLYISSKLTCTTCSSGYYVVSGNCSSCPSNCQTCTNSTNCNKCLSGHYLVAGGCLATSTLVDNCNSYTSSACSSCQSGYYLSNSKCQPCSLLCSSCYGIHSGQCNTCTSQASLYNQICLPTNYLSNTQYQMYYAYPSAASLLSGGTESCNRYIYQGQQISLQLNSLAASKLRITWRLFSLGGSSTYTVSFANSGGNSTSTFTTSSSTGQTYSLCSNSSDTFSLSIASQNYTTIKVNNTLTFSTNNGMLLGLQQVLVVIDMCNSLCIECSSVLCTQCLLSNLYTQDAYCVYTCSSGYYIYYNTSSVYNPHSCVQQCPVGTYPLSTNLTCVPCVSPCLSCLNDNYCLSCIASYFLTSQNTCKQICPYQYFGQVLTQTCQKCVGRCNECLDQLKCLNCRSGFYYAANYSCLDSCSPSLGLVGLYADLTTLTCKSCSSQCLNCIMSPTYCTSCPPTMNFYNYTCLSNCPSGYYSDSNLTCQLCTYPCQSCITSATKCLSCFDRYLFNSTCVVNCPSGYFQNNQGLVCSPCSSGCSICVNSASYCTQCSSGYYLFNNTCVNACPSFYYPNATLSQCISCSGLCYDCTNQTFCLSCTSNFLWKGTCVSNSQCPIGYYGQIKNLTCLICSSVCYTCQFTTDHCTSCKSNSSNPYLLNNTCVSTCLSAFYYASNSTGFPMCLQCSSPCQTCANATYCLSCVAGYMLSGGLCSTSCSVGYYFNSSIVGCNACSSNCFICSSVSFCQLCQSGYYVYSLNTSNNQCLQTCPAYYYANSQSGSCQLCIYPCKQCSSSLDCLSCQSGVLYQGRCISSCPDTTYLNQSASTCSACSFPCLTCFNSSTYCISCQTSYYLYTINNTCISSCYVATYPETITQMCLQCPSSCSSCLNDTYCLSCLTGVTFLYSLTNNCITNCPLGYFGNSTAAKCQTCVSKCLTCSTKADSCLSCSSGYYLVRLSVSSYDCLTSCPNGYYKQVQTCQACIFPCNTCQSATACLTCVVGTYFYAASSACLLSCPSNSYLNSTNATCISCQSPCISCKSTTYCLSCKTGLYLNSGSCLPLCPSSTYSDATFLCLPCSGLCKTCSSKYYCLSCVTGYLSNGFCYSSCPPGTFANLNISSCISCISPCVQCAFAANYCTRCAAGLVQFQGNCTSSCPLGTYVSDSSCLDCSFPCVNCSSSTTCHQCLGGYLLYNQIICINDTTFCPNDFFKMDGKYCIPQSQCPTSYFIDLSQRTCSSTCPPQKYVDTQIKRCNYSCKSDQYVSSGMICRNYSTPPISLMSMSVISYIKSSVVNLYISFNESMIWLNTNATIYDITTYGRRLILSSNLQYTMDPNDAATLLLRVKDLPDSIDLRLPAQNVMSTASGYPLQTPNATVSLPKFVAYQYSSIYQGYSAQQFGQGLGWFILLLTLVFLFKNRISHLYILWDTVQLLFVLLFLDIQYPPTLNQFLLGLNSVFFQNFPSFFPVPTKRMVSDRPFYAYSKDCSFVRNAGFCITFLIFVGIFYVVLKLLQWFIKKTESGKKCSQTLPRFKKFVFEMLLRYRWHYASDVFFLTYMVVCLFGVAQLYHISSNPQNSFSNALCIISLILYLLFPIFVSTKLYRHFPNISKGRHVENLRCFYRGIDKTSQFGVFLVVIRYFRKVVYALAVGIFSSKPMYALPILMMISGMMALFIFVNLPYKKRLSNIVETISQICITLLYLGLAFINFNNQSNNPSTNIIIGFICTGLLIFILLLEVFQVFCRSLFNLQSEEELRKKDQGLAGLEQDQLRKKAGQFFDFMFPRIRKEFGFGEDSEDQVHKYQEGDSQNSQNNEQRERQWEIQSSSHSQQFRHYDNNSQSQATEPKKQPPQYLVRCVKELQ